MITIVDDSLVDKVVNAIVNVTSSGSPGDGKIFIYNVEDAIDIGTKKRGKEAI